MKKAKEYAKDYNESKNKVDALAHIWYGLTREIAEIAKIRNVATSAGFASIIDEQENKWFAIIKRIELHERHKDAWRSLLVECFPDTLLILNAVESKTILRER